MIDIKLATVLMMQDATLLATQQLLDLLSLLFLQLGPVTILHHPDDPLYLFPAEVDMVILKSQQLAEKEDLACSLGVQHVMDAGKIMRYY